MLSLRCFVFVACVAFAAGAACPVEKFVGSWEGSCSQTTFPKASCTYNSSASDPVAACPLSTWGIAQGYDGSTTAPCTQTFSFAVTKSGGKYYYEYKAGALVAGSVCKNPLSGDNLFPLLSVVPAYETSFSVNDIGVTLPYFGPSPPCLLVAGETPPTASTNKTFLASINSATGEYKEYGSYDSTFNYVSPGAPLNLNAYNESARPTSAWSSLGQMYGNQALTARPNGSPPLAASATLYPVASTPLYTYTCTAKKVGSTPPSPVKSTGATNFASACLLILALFSVAAF
jgi:hypothetical protein